MIRTIWSDLLPLARRLASSLLVIFLMGCTMASAQNKTDAPPATFWCYIGSTGGKLPAGEQGIFVSRFDATTGTLSAPTLAAHAKEASFVEPHSNGKFLYAAQAEGVAGYLIDHDNGSLTPINAQPSGGSGACHVSLDATGKVLLAANYGSGSEASFLVADDGSIGPIVSVMQNRGSGPNQSRQESPHAHSFFVDPSNRFALACDLGTDHVLVFKLDIVTGKLTANDPAFAKVPPGAGPRHLVFAPDARFVYVVNELSSTITAFAWNSQTGELSLRQNISMLPENWKGDAFAAEVRVHPSGRFLYASNRGHDSIAIFSIDQTTGLLSFIGTEPTRGKWPRNFQIDPTGHWLVVANEHTNDLFVFAIDAQTGKLTATGHRIEVPAASCVRFVQ